MIQRWVKSFTAHVINAHMFGWTSWAAEMNLNVESSVEQSHL